MMATENKEQIRYTVQYIPERKTVLLWVSAAAMFEIPFDIFKNFYYQMDQAQKTAQSNLLVPDNNIVVPDLKVVK